MLSVLLVLVESSGAGRDERGRLHISQTWGFENSSSLEVLAPPVPTSPEAGEAASVCDSSAGSTNLR